MDYTKKSLVATTDTVVKEGNTKMVGGERKTKPNMVKEAITPPISEKTNIDTVKETYKSQASNTTVASIEQLKATNAISFLIEEYLKSKMGNRIDSANAILKNENKLMANQECIIYQGNIKRWVLMIF